MEQDSESGADASVRDRRGSGREDGKQAWIGKEVEG
jgi:hypothetical protein